MRFQAPVFLALLAVIPSATAQLNALAKKAGKLYFGTATDNGELNNTRYVSILSNTAEFGQLVPSNGQKWFATEPEQGVFNFTYGDVVVNLARKNKQLLRCHNLVWHSQLAPWVEAGNWTKESLTKVMVNHITHVMTHYKGKCYAWDVLNEALNDDGTYRDTVFLRVIGPEYIRIAFATAAKVDPSAKLYYNDYNLENIGNKTNSARKNIVQYLQAAHIRIDGVGLQAHLVAGSAPSLSDQIANLRLFDALHVNTAYTELDVRMDLPVTADKLAIQAQNYADSVEACLSVRSCVGVTVWDFYDPFSWIPGVFPGQGAALLWNEDFTLKPAYAAIVKVLKKYKGSPSCE